MRLGLTLLLLLLACASCSPVAQGTERPGDATSLYALERHAEAVVALESRFLSLIDAAPGEERFYLYWTYNHLTGSWFHVDYLEELLELSCDAPPHSDEESMRAALRGQAEFVRWELGNALEDLEDTMPEFLPPNHSRINEALRSLLSEIRTTVDRLWADQCADVPCVASH